MIRPQSKRVRWTAAHKKLKTRLNQYHQQLSVQEMRWVQAHNPDVPPDLKHLIAACLKESEAKEGHNAVGRSVEENANA